ncbi:MAG: hypothetical protein ACRCZO_04915 [Cetobacterium sp.]
MIEKKLLGILILLYSFNLKGQEVNVPIKAKIQGGGLVITSSEFGVANDDIIFNFGEFYKNDIPLRENSEILPQSKKMYIKTTDGTLPIGSKIRVDLFTTTMSTATTRTKYLTNDNFTSGDSNYIKKNTINHLVSTKFENVKILDHLQVGNTVDVAQKLLRILGNDNSTFPDYYGMRLKTCAILETETNSAIPLTITSKIVDTATSNSKIAGKFSQVIYLGVQFSKTDNEIWVRDCIQGVPIP